MNYTLFFFKLLQCNYKKYCIQITKATSAKQQLGLSLDKGGLRASCLEAHQQVNQGSAALHTTTSH